MANYSSFISRVNIGSKQLTQRRKWQSRQRHPQCRHRELPDASGLLLTLLAGLLNQLLTAFPRFPRSGCTNKKAFKGTTNPDTMKLFRHMVRDPWQRQF
jgi:hypothetical protein